MFFFFFSSLSLFTPLGLGWLWHLSSCPVWFGLVVGGCAVGPGTLYLQPVPALAWFSCLWQVQHYMPCFFNASLDYIYTSIVKQVREEGRRKKEREKKMHICISDTHRVSGTWVWGPGLCTGLASRCMSRFFNASYTQQYIYICRVSVACEWRPGVGLWALCPAAPLLDGSFWA